MIQTLSHSSPVRSVGASQGRFAPRQTGPVDRFIPSEPGCLPSRPLFHKSAAPLKKQGFKLAMWSCIAAVGIASFTGCTPANPNFHESKPAAPIVQVEKPTAAAPRTEVAAQPQAPLTELQLRERELALKERELKLKEQELAITSRSAEKQNRVNDLRERELRQKQFERNAQAAGAAVDVIGTGLSEFARQVLR